MNTKLLSSYRSYNTNIPIYLHERPHAIIKHCMERRDASGNIQQHQVVIIVDEEKGEFNVRSEQDANKEYRVSFGTDTSPPVLPSCECYDWERNRLPCKHFFAVFAHFPKWSFEQLPDSYKKSPFLTVDEFVSPAQQRPAEIDDLSDSYLTENDFEDPTQSTTCAIKQPVLINELPLKKTFHKTEAARSREILGQIKNMTYIAEGWQDVKLLEKLNVKLEKCLRLLNDSAPKENGITLEVPPQKQPAKKNVPLPVQPLQQHESNKISSSSYMRLPTRLKKNPYSGRCGEKAMSLKRSYVSNLSEIEGKPAKIHVSKQKENVIIDCIVNNDDEVADDQFVKSTPPTNFRVGEVDASSDMYNMNLKNPSNEEVIIITTVQTETP